MSKRNSQEHPTRQEEETMRKDSTNTERQFLALSTDFESTKKHLSSVGNYYFNSLFNVLGYQYKGSIEHANILHLSAEAWLLGAFGELRKEFNEKNEKHNYSNLLNQIKQIIVEENVFSDNMRLLTGIYHINELTLEDNRIFKMFLVNIHSVKNEILQDDSIMKQNLTQENFNEILIRIFRTAFNLTLNDLNSNETRKKSTDLLNLYLELKQQYFSNNSSEVTVDTYINKYFEKKNIKENTLTKTELEALNLHLTIFFYFSESSMENLLGEILLFNANAGSILYKIRNLISLKNIRRTTLKYYELLSYYLERGLVNLKLESVLAFYRSVLEKLEPLKTQAVEIVKNNYNISKKWIDHTIQTVENFTAPQIKNAMAALNKLYENGMYFTEAPRKFVFENIYQPLKNLTVQVTETSVNIVIDTFSYGKDKSLLFANYVIEIVVNAFNGAKNLVFGEEPLIKIDYDAGEEKKYLSISLSKKLFVVDPVKIVDFIKSLIEKIRNFDIQETVHQAYVFSTEKVVGVKNYVIESYRKFLELACEDECEGEKEKTS